LVPYLWKVGFWAVYKRTFEGLDTEDYLIHIVLLETNDGWTVVEQEAANKLINITAEEMDSIDSEIDSIPLFDDNISEAELLFKIICWKKSASEMKNTMMPSLTDLRSMLNRC
jgi:hypothetical protein